MKIIIAVILSVDLVLLITSCHKEPLSAPHIVITGMDTNTNPDSSIKDTIDPAASIFGKWSIVSDSFYIVDAPSFWQPFY